jgi:DNA-directed RNA polymerase specialized sigma24 family protein
LHDDLADRHLALRECLKQLKPESRELLLSRHERDESLVELASRVGRPVGNIKVTLCRLRSALSD